MEFGFTVEEYDLQQLAKKFASNELAPRYLERATKDEFPWDVYRKMGELGFLGMRIDEKYGGQRGSYVMTGILSEELAKADINCSFYIFLSSFYGDFFSLYGTEKQKREFLPSIASGQRVVAFAVTEPSCGSDMAAISTRARAEGDHFVLTGEKSSISVVMAADTAIVFAKTAPELGAKGISAFLVPLDAPGVHRYSFNDLGFRPMQRGGFALDDVRVPAANLIGEIGKGFSMAAQGFDYGRVLISLMVIGAAVGALERTSKYVRERMAFGQPIGRFEGVSFPIVEYTSMLEAIRLLCYKTLWLKDQGFPHSKESAMCKWMAPKVAREAIHECLLLHGHLGYADELPFAQLLKDVIAFEIADGTAQIQKLIIARELLGRECLPY